MTLRAGLHVQQGPRFGDAVAMVRRSKPGIVLWCDTAPRDVMAEVRSWGGLNVARRYWPHGTEWRVLTGENGPESLATMVYDGWMERFGGTRDLVDYAVGANEYWGVDKPAIGQMRLAYEFERSLAHKFKTIGVKYAAYSLPPGNIEPHMWAQIMAWCKEDGIDFVGDALCVHTYWRSPAGPTSRESYDPDAPYLVGREVHYEPWPNITVNGQRSSLPILIGEYGFDHSLSGYPKTGFTKQYTMHDRDAVYAQHLIDGSNLLSQLAEKHQRTYIGWTLFTVGGDPVWTEKGFDATGIWQIEKAIASQQAHHDEYAQPEPEEPQPDSIYGYQLSPEEVAAGVRLYAEERPDGSIWVVRHDPHAPAGQEYTQFLVQAGTTPEEPPAPAALIRTMDVSSHQPTNLTALIRETGAQQVIVRMYQPGELPSQDHSRAQVESARANNCRVGAYMWLYAAWDARKQIRDAVALARDCGLSLRYLWIDYEPYTDGTMPTIEQLFQACSACLIEGVKPGVYSSKWCYPDDTTMVDTNVPLWAAQYDGIESVDNFIPFGGWTQCAAKQYQGSPIDLSAWRAEYAEALPGDEPAEPPVEEPNYEALYNEALLQLAFMLSRAETAEAKLAAIRTAGGW